MSGVKQPLWNLCMAALRVQGKKVEVLLSLLSLLIDVNLLSMRHHLRAQRLDIHANDRNRLRISSRVPFTTGAMGLVSVEREGAKVHLLGEEGTDLRASFRWLGSQPLEPVGWWLRTFVSSASAEQEQSSSKITISRRTTPH